jgi:hypothetical protein
MEESWRRKWKVVREWNVIVWKGILFLFSVSWHYSTLLQTHWASVSLKSWYSQLIAPRCWRLAVFVIRDTLRLPRRFVFGKFVRKPNFLWSEAFVTRGLTVFLFQQKTIKRSSWKMGTPRFMWPSHLVTFMWPVLQNMRKGTRVPRLSLHSCISQQQQHTPRIMYFVYSTSSVPEFVKNSTWQHKNLSRFVYTFNVIRRCATAISIGESLNYWHDIDD